MVFENKFSLNNEEEKLLINKNIVQLVYTTGKFEGLPTSLPQTEAIINNYEVSGVKPDDIATILNLKRGYEYLLDQLDKQVTFNDLLILNKIVKGGVAYSGILRTKDVQVPLTNDIWQPPIPSERTKTAVIDLLNTDKSATAKALDLNLMLSRLQLFMDGNKRTAILAANLLLVQSGAGFLAIPEAKMHWYGSKLTKFYRNNQAQSIKQWLYDNCLFGM
ncbi:hypothetical protein EFO90_07035 [Lactiplantibacillus plantarum]|uniref:Fic family protein n=1 Tax=Lactiplantibacillus plantarum TaxID=1590 RepID=UPI0021A89B31|nr:Fic family protein [Lactiplantibacillus plantarum]MCT3214146.1 hypothetical protein [Lactiplantibacillus plantarum]MCT3271714.1 hypothetical protein [Lactiplantibacillus plantarum]